MWFIPYVPGPVAVALGSCKMQGNGSLWIYLVWSRLCGPWRWGAVEYKEMVRIWFILYGPGPLGHGHEEL